MFAIVDFGVDRLRIFELTEGNGMGGAVIADEVTFRYRPFTEGSRARPSQRPPNHKEHGQNPATLECVKNSVGDSDERSVVECQRDQRRRHPRNASSGPRLDAGVPPRTEMLGSRRSEVGGETEAGERLRGGPAQHITQHEGGTLTRGEALQG